MPKYSLKYLNWAIVFGIKMLRRQVSKREQIALHKVEPVRPRNPSFDNFIAAQSRITIFSLAKTVILPTAVKEAFEYSRL